MSLTFVTTVVATATVPVHLSVYDANSNPLLPSVMPISWVLPAGVTVSSDATGYNFLSSTVQQATIVGHNGLAVGSVMINFNAPPLFFTAP